MPTIPVLGENDPSSINIDSIPVNKFQTGEPIYSSVRNAIDRLATVVANALYETIGALKPTLASTAESIKQDFETAFNQKIRALVGTNSSVTVNAGNESTPTVDTLTFQFGNQSPTTYNAKVTEYASKIAGVPESNRSLATGVLKDINVNQTMTVNVDCTVDSVNERLNLMKTTPNGSSSTAANLKFNIPGIKIVNGVMYVTKTNVS